MREGRESGRRGDERRKGEWEEGGGEEGAGRREIEQWPVQSTKQKSLLRRLRRSSDKSGKWS